MLLVLLPLPRYRVPKLVTIRDVRLGAANFCLMLVVVLYVFVKAIIMDKGCVSSWHMCASH